MVVEGLLRSREPAEGGKGFAASHSSACLRSPLAVPPSLVSDCTVEELRSHFSALGALDGTGLNIVGTLGATKAGEST